MKGNFVALGLHLLLYTKVFQEYCNQIGGNSLNTKFEINANNAKKTPFRRKGGGGE
jgi:hypothetical protein